MSESDSVKKIVVELFPDACDQVGPSNVSDIVTGRLDYSSPREGRKIDLWHIIERLIEVASIIKFLFEMYPVLQAKLKRNPTKNELKDELEKSDVRREHLKEKEIDEIVEAALKDRDSNASAPGSTATPNSE
jgi:hypothetical protein